MTYRPQQWQGQAQVYLFVPGTASNTGTLGSGVTGNSAAVTLDDGTTATPAYSATTSRHWQDGAQPMTYVFDATFRTEHERAIQKTEHPVQSGANVSDHAIIMPARVVLEIGMSDAMDSFISNQWGAKAKGVKAFETLKMLAEKRQPMTVATRLFVYNNMLVTSVHAADTVETQFGLRATITFEELMTGTVTQQQVSARPDATGSTSLGNKSGIPVPPTIDKRFLAVIPENGPTTPNPGAYSSNPTNASTFDYSNYPVSE